jgi:hypothetical protein
MWGTKPRNYPTLANSGRTWGTKKFERGETGL